MKNFLLLSAIYLFAPQLAAAEDFDELRRNLAEKLPEAAIGTIRKLPYADLYEVQGNGVNVFYTNALGEVALCAGGSLVPGALTRAQIASRLHPGRNS